MNDVNMVLTIDEVLDYLGIDYADEKVNRNITRAIATADKMLQGSIGVNYPIEDARSKELALIIVSDLYDIRGVTTRDNVSNNVRRLVEDMSLQLKLELNSEGGDTPNRETFKAPIIGDNKNWFVWDSEILEYVDTGICAEGYIPKKGVDYWTLTDKAEIKKYIDGETEIIKSDIETLQAQINEEAHFRGYLSTNAKIQALAATPNDFAYSAESGTKWVYDAEKGWIDTGSTVPDQLTPASDVPPLMDGVASAGEENTYSRSDHRHPTDTTRASAEDVRVNTESIAEAFRHIQLHEQQIDEHENRISTNEDVIGQNLNRIINVENRATEIENDLATYGDFELIDSDEFTEDVVNVTPTIEQNYKELYMVFTIPTVNPDGSNTDKCRIRCYANNNKDFLVQGAAYVENYKEEWNLFIHAKFIANYIKADIFHITSRTNKMGYIVAPSSSTQNGVIQPGIEMDEDYFNNLTIKMFDANGKQILRYFPSGTKYELWGVKK